MVIAHVPWEEIDPPGNTMSTASEYFVNSVNSVILYKYIHNDFVKGVLILH